MSFDEPDRERETVRGGKVSNPLRAIIQLDDLLSRELIPLRIDTPAGADIVAIDDDQLAALDHAGSNEAMQRIRNRADFAKLGIVEAPSQYAGPLELAAAAVGPFGITTP